VIQASNIEKLQKDHLLRMRKTTERNPDQKMIMFRQKNNIDLDHRKEALRSTIEEINKKLQQDADEMKLAKMMDRVAVQTQAQIAKNKKAHNKGQKAIKAHRKNRSSDSDMSDEKACSPNFEGSKLPRKQSRSFEETSSSQEEYSEKDGKIPGSGAPFQKGERIRIRRSGSDD